MPDDVEIETENLREAIHEEMERQGESLLKTIAVSTAIFAAIAAVAALKAGGTANEALILQTEATRLQAEASDQWAYYQAKGIKAAVQESARTSWLAIGREAPAQYADAEKRYKKEQEEMAKTAKEKEHARDEKVAEAAHLFHGH